MEDCLKKLLGRCCCPASTCEGWEEVPVQALAGRMALTGKGAIPLKPGHHPRPGQRIVVGGGLAAGATSGHRNRPHFGQSEVALPTAPSYDSPQRPGHWGSGFIPGVAAEPTQPPRAFTHTDVGEVAALPPPAPFFPPFFQRPDGGADPLPAADPLRVTASVGAVTVKLTRTILYVPPSAEAFDPYGQGVYHPRGDIEATPETFSDWGALPALLPPGPGETPLNFTRPVIRFRTNGIDNTIAEWAPLPARNFNLLHTDVWAAFDAYGTRWRETPVSGQPSVPLLEGAVVVTERRGPITRGVIKGTGEEGSGEDVMVINRYRLDRPGETIPTVYVTLAMQADVGVEGDPEPWQAGAVLEVSLFGDPVPFDVYSCTLINSMPREYTSAPDLPWTERSWRTPDGLIQYTQGDGEAVPDTLTAYGVTLTGGTWAGLCSAVTPEQRTRWATAQPGPTDAVVLHEAEGTVTAVFPDGTAQTCSASTFQAQVLGGGTLTGFSPLDLGHNAWPPQWAWAVTGTDEGRAVVAWEAWRDSTKQEWPGRPKKRPDPEQPLTLPPGLRPPLGLTLATTARAPRFLEALTRTRNRQDEGEAWYEQQTPWHVPLTVERGTDGTSAAALNALAKHALWQPGRLEEELDDTSSIKPGTYRLTWAGPILPPAPGPPPLAALLLRAKAQAGVAPVLTIGGTQATVRPLGRNAGLKGWQPFVATWGAEYAAVHAAGLTLTCSAPLSRLLLTRVGRGKAEGGGTDA